MVYEILDWEEKKKIINKEGYEKIFLIYLLMNQYSVINLWIEFLSSVVY